MAQRQMQRLLALRNDRSLARHRVEGIAIGKQLGTGSYGSVEEIMVNGLICAGKKIHEVLIHADNEGAENLAVKYVQECELMSTLRHPNIALFLGVCFLDNSSLPVLLIEKLDCSLDDLLENVSNIPLPLKRSMLEDVTRGLLYLHKNNIIHRDLTARNVLLTTALVAKVTDFGNSRFVDLQPGELARTLSRLPGTLVYMPPEAFEASSHYGPSLDIFSFGHLALFVGLQKFPGTLLQPNYPDPEDPDNFIGRSEVRRREQYFKQLDDLLPGGIRPAFVQLVKNCLHNSPSRRPIAEQLITSLELMKGDVDGPYGELATVDAVRWVRMMKALKAKKNVEIEQLQEQVEVDMARLREAHEADLRQKDTQLEQQARAIQQMNTQLREKDERLTEKDERLRERDERLREKDERLREKDERLREKTIVLQQKDVELQRRNAEISRLRMELQESQVTLIQHSDAELIRRSRALVVKTPLTELTQLPLKMTWRRGKDIPFGVYDYPQAIVFKGKVYIGGGRSSLLIQTVIIYDPQLDSYDTLPPYPYSCFSMGVVNNQLVLVGGIDIQTGKNTNKLGVWNEQTKTWTCTLPPMTTACSSISAVSYKNRWLIVIGGNGDKTSLSRVEILDTTRPGQWHLAAPLPQPRYCASTATTGNMSYLVCGYSTGGSQNRTVFKVCLDDLISQAVPQPAGTSAPSTPSPWTTMPATPLTGSTALCLNEALLTVGGLGFYKTIYHYQPSTRRWIKAGELPTGRQGCACTVLPSGGLFVTGGDGHRTNAHVDIASIQY